MSHRRTLGAVQLKLKELDGIYNNNSRSTMLMAQSDWLSARWLRHQDLSQAYMLWRQLLARHCRMNNCPFPDPENTMDQLMLFLADVNPRCKADGHQYFRNTIALFNMKIESMGGWRAFDERNRLRGPLPGASCLFCVFLRRTQNWRTASGALHGRASQRGDAGCPFSLAPRHPWG